MVINTVRARVWHGIQTCKLGGISYLYSKEEEEKRLYHKDSRATGFSTINLSATDRLEVREPRVSRSRECPTFDFLE